MEHYMPKCAFLFALVITLLGVVAISAHNGDAASSAYGFALLATLSNLVMSLFLAHQMFENDPKELTLFRIFCAFTIVFTIWSEFLYFGNSHNGPYSIILTVYAIMGLACCALVCVCGCCYCVHKCTYKNARVSVHITVDTLPIPTLCEIV